MLFYFRKTYAIKVWPFSQFFIAGEVFLSNGQALRCYNSIESELHSSVKCFYIQAGLITMFLSLMIDCRKGEIGRFAFEAQFFY